MPTRGDWMAATPKCDRVAGQTGMQVGPCCRPLRWVQVPGAGAWYCVLHGPVLSGRDAAARAGFVMVVGEAA